MHRLYVDYFGVNRWTTTLRCRRMVRSLRIRAVERNRFRWAFMFNDILGRGSELSAMERSEYAEWWREVITTIALELRVDELVRLVRWHLIKDLKDISELERKMSTDSLDSLGK